jgi:hypothetical protein
MKKPIMPLLALLVFLRANRFAEAWVTGGASRDGWSASDKLAGIKVLNIF